MAQTSGRFCEYETIYVLNPEISDGTAKEFMLKMKDLVSKEGGKNIKVDCWGRRKLAWERGKSSRGLYVHHLYLGKPGLVAEYERNLGIDESVMLRQSVVVNSSVDPEARAEQADQLEAPIVRERKDFPRMQDFGGYDDGPDSDEQLDD